MSQPKKKTSRSRRDRRRYASGNALGKTAFTNCPACDEPVRPHRVCACGVYKEQTILPPPAVDQVTE